MVFLYVVGGGGLVGWEGVISNFFYCFFKIYSAYFTKSRHHSIFLWIIYKFKNKVL